MQHDGGPVGLDRVVLFCLLPAALFMAAVFLMPLLRVLWQSVTTIEGALTFAGPSSTIG